MITVHAEQLAIHVEPQFIALDLVDSASGFTARSALTSDHARRIAAELLMAAEKADSTIIEGDFEEIA